MKPVKTHTHAHTTQQLLKKGIGADKGKPAEQQTEMHVILEGDLGPCYINRGYYADLSLTQTHTRLPGAMKHK